MSKDTEKEKVQKNGSRRTRRTSLSAAHVAIAVNLAMANTVATDRVTRSMAARTRAMAVALAVATPRLTRATTAKGRVREVTRALAKTVPAAEITRGLARTCASLMLQAFSKPSTGTWLIRRQQVTPLYWVRVRHVQEIVAYEAIIRAMFHGCVELRSRCATPSILGAHFRGTVEVGFARREDANAAVQLFRRKIDMLYRRWTIKHCTPQQPPDAAFSSRLTVSERQNVPEVRISGTSRLPDAFRSDDSHMVIVYIVDPRTPPQVVVLLFQTLDASLRRCTFLKDTDGCFSGIVELEYESRDDAANIADHFHRNVRIFGRKFWEVVCVQAEDAFNNSDDDDNNDNDNDSDNDDDDDDDDDNEDDDDAAAEDDGNDEVEEYQRIAEN